MESWRDRIVSIPDICHGAATFRGTRVMVSVVLDNLAADVPHPEILASYPPISEDDIKAALKYAAELAREEIVPLPVAAA